MPISESKITIYQDSIKDLPDRPSEAGISAERLKALFDSRTDNEVKEKLNELIDALGKETAAGEIGAVGGTVQQMLDTLLEAVDGKQEKQEGFGLYPEDKAATDNNFTTEEKEKLAGIEAGSNAYTLPEASAEVLGGIRLGTGLVLQEDGTVSAIDETARTRIGDMKEVEAETGGEDLASAILAVNDGLNFTQDLAEALEGRVSALEAGGGTGGGGSGGGGTVDLSDYYTKDETDAAIKEAVDNVDVTVDLSGYYTKTETDEAIETAVDEIDLTGYATEDYVGKKIAEAQLGGGSGTVDLSAYYTKGETDAAIKTAVDAVELLPGPKGDPGVSCTHAWNGTTLTVTSASGTSSADLKGEPGHTPVKGEDYFDGAPGEDGISPVAVVTQTDTGATITITDKTGTTSAAVTNGKDGDKGDPGATPVRGTDYWTDADKQEIINSVLAALPAAEGVSF